MVKRRIGLLDIANKVGVSKATISRYLNTPDLVSPSLQKRISQVVETLGYLPNKAPSILSNAKSHAIGIFIPSITGQVFGDVLSGIEATSDAYGYQAMITHTGRHQDKEEIRLRSLLSYNIDGLILTERTHSPSAMKMISLAGIPVVEIMDSVLPCIDMAVGYDNFKAAKQMVERIIATGKRNIAYLSAQLDERSIQRKAGYEAAMAEHDLQTYTLPTTDLTSYELGENLLHQLLQCNPQVDAVFCCNDTLALGVFFECQRLNIKVPQQLAIAGFHGHNIGQHVYPKLTSVLTPRYEMGKIAADMLIRRLNGETLTQKVIELPVEYLNGSTI
ncbi:substrate-binding domain-containing protein [Orbaceae bacterium ESL0727]|nr:substrate-binding domain-containing protein [Orbaceae bacterium ESL0727]